ncbi:DnaA ATPase domain-containing protein [Olsenella sp. HMSC062G07]|uniref:DnaA ATPase domain-containing protein n=1 Tax=Olsenella sp. HMSC062G07 TaxID=1739330 RepID=UPI0008A1694B|nr:DnaA/Hda family protein [Olsenella sp. HMSC062G07]OFK22271.1 chromosomal replication initiator DnaA [Olsenella sp. HMSC062G07]
MDSTQDDAKLLWHDVLVMLDTKSLAPSVLAMLKSCDVIGFDGTALSISTNLGFAQRKIRQCTQLIEACLNEAAFQPVELRVLLAQPSESMEIDTSSHLSSSELRRITSEARAQAPAKAHSPSGGTATNASPLADTAGDLADSKLTFERFVAGEENMLAFEAAKQVANGENKGYNPLFIYGKSGLGKTHLLRAIQNYVVTNDPSRVCVYRTAAEFVEDYRIAWNNSETSARSALSNNYQNVDILIIDDVQNMRTAAGTIRFFFETFNALMAHGKQIVLAADRSPSQLGMGESKFDERETSRMDSGVTVSIQVPDYELKLNLINAFYERMRQDAEREHVGGLTGSISEDMRQLMAERSGTNIRVIEGFVQTCIMNAGRLEQKGTALGREDVIRLANAKWPSGQRAVTIEQIQKAVEGHYDVSHSELVGSKRNKELMEPRHVGIWLTRELTDNTLADIGKKFGGRSHATVKHSIIWVDKAMKEDRLFLDQLETLKDSIIDKG